MNALKPTIQRMWQTSRSLSIIILIFAALNVLTISAAFFDTRILVGAPLWYKPIKFTLSATIYCASLLWILSHITRWKLAARAIGFLAGANLLFDVGWVIFQAARGVRSHYNVSTAFDSSLYYTVGTSISVVVGLNLIAIVVVLAQRIRNRTLATALTFGLLTCVVGGFSALPMKNNTTPAQQALVDQEAQVDVLGGHSFGVEEGGPGLPFLGWSTAGGDGRVPHFIGLHSLQILPLLGLWIDNRWRNRLAEWRRVSMVAVVGIGYVALILLLLWQALRGQSVIAPDSQTIIAFASLFGVVAAMLVTLVKSAPTQPVIPAIHNQK